MKRTFVTIFLACLLLFAVLAGCAAPAQNDPVAPTEKPTETSEKPAESTEPTAQPQEHEAQVTVTPLGEINAAKDYEEIRTSLRSSSDRAYGFGGYGGDDDAVATETAAAEAAEEPAAYNAEGGADVFDMSDYGTNVQVAGIDEADNVKTDGKYIYVLNGLDVFVVEANGAETADAGYFELSGNGEPLVEWEETDEGSISRYSNGLLLYGDRLALIYTVNSWGSDAEGNWYDRNETRLAIYVLEDGGARQVADVGQDGYYQSARMKDGVIYLVTTKSVYDITEDSDPDKYVPCVYNGAEATMLPAERVYLCPEINWPCFTIVGSYGLESGENLDVCAFTGSTDTVYMNEDALYLARSVQKQDESEPYAENQYTVVDYVSSALTEIKRVSLGDTLTLDASCTLEGSLLNQFALDVYNGYLRAATSTYSYSYSIYRDEVYDFENYVWHDNDEQNSRVTILDSDLNEVGRLDELADDERIYSVRFFGDVGYVVTYRNIDPVFTIDLSDPAHPTLESALEVPGVSNYLHVYKDGKLFGFGQAVNENAASEGLQLSMFDVADPKNVFLEAQDVIKDAYSNALYDHHALLIRGSLDLIGFPMYGNYDWSNSYRVYSYENGKFVLQGEIALDYYPDSARGIVIDGVLYICGEFRTYVIDLSDYTLIADVSSAVG